MEYGMLSIIVCTFSQLLKKEYLLMLTEIFSFCDEHSSHQPLIGVWSCGQDVTHSDLHLKQCHVFPNWWFPVRYF